jgi:hypothetical protein
MIQRLFTIACFALAVSAIAVEAHEHKVLGTLKTAAADHVLMTTTEGKTVTVKLNARTKVIKGKEPVKIETVKEGTRLVVTTESDDDPYTAELIQVGNAPQHAPNKPQHPPDKK